MLLLQIVSIIILLILLVLSYYGLKYLWPLKISGDWTIIDDSSIKSTEDGAPKFSFSKNSIKGVMTLSDGETKQQNIKLAFDQSESNSNKYIGPVMGGEGAMIVEYNKDDTISMYGENKSNQIFCMGK